MPRPLSVCHHFFLVNSHTRRPGCHRTRGFFACGVLVVGLVFLAFAAAPVIAIQVPQPIVEIAPEEPLTVGDEQEIDPEEIVCNRTITAKVVAIDQMIVMNRLMAFLPSGMIYALERDVVPRQGNEIGAGNAKLRVNKRPRPLVLRMNVRDCLVIKFRNLLAHQRVNQNQPATRNASIHVDGLTLLDIQSSGSNVGDNASSLVGPGDEITYRWYASKEGQFVFRSAGALTGGEGDGGQPDHGLFGAVIVEPKGSTWYRSQVTAEELDYATDVIDVDGNRKIDYDAKYPTGHRFAGKPVLAILDGNEIFHGDLNAIITDIPANNYPPVVAAAPDNGPVMRDRNEPFREFTVLYHDEKAIVQAFDVLEDEFFAHSIRDNMAINYGTGGIGAEIISYGADQIVGNTAHIPAGHAKKCNDCKYEEAFLSSWAVGDPAMIVERDDPDPGEPLATGDAIRALYPDDPSNVHHSYLNDHVKMRVLHGGVAEHHIHHLHAHQWLHQQNSDNSTYFDSQAIGPGSGFVLDIAYNGGGNRNKTVGDSIFHCHFYPHFAQGMWELWRVHDVFEDGTRRLPDAEIPEGTPIPALVPLPGIAMAPPPTPALPGYPFFIPGLVGHRPPHPPLDTLHDGGLPRHRVRGGKVLDGLNGMFDRIHLEMDAEEVPELGTPAERRAMDFHAQRLHDSVTPNFDFAYFVTNGLPPTPGAPYADPCVDDNGDPAGVVRIIKGAAIQIRAIFNKAGWHFDQTRMFAHWGDVNAYQTGARPPEPFFMRANSNDCIEYHFVNLIPHVYERDDFQIYTPTDVVGQHIHLVKFDVTSSDGAGNGYNYEDGSFAPEEVIERIEAINAVGGLDDGTGNRVLLEPEDHPVFGVTGAQTTIQRWWADPLLNAQGVDRTLRTVFTHDHFGPSTHQQAGLYAALLVEPENSRWRDPETGTMLGTRDDGGPTSWRADIITEDPSESYREFMLEFQDFHLAYDRDNRPINPPGRVEIPLPHLVEPPPQPMPEGVSADDPGTMTVNYRNEPIAMRIRNPQNNEQAVGIPGDLAHAYRSDVDRADDRFDVQPNFYPPLTEDVRPGDPFTPLMRVYEGDRVQVRIITGAHEEGHNIAIHGLRWLHEPDDKASGYRANQMQGISEKHELEIDQMPYIAGDAVQADFLYQPGASVDDQWNGLWGILREYKGLRDDLEPLPNNADGRLPDLGIGGLVEAIGPSTAPVRTFDITAVRAADALPGGAVVYNQGHRLHDPTALLYVHTSDLDANGQLRAGVPIEPLTLRANAGDVIKLTLRNGFRNDPLDEVGFNMWPMLFPYFNANQVVPSSSVGLHPQLVHYDVNRDNGVNVGFNDLSTVEPFINDSHTYHWYAGKLTVDESTGRVRATPIEFGATNLIPADLMKHSNKGLVGSLIIEPKGSTWTFPEASTRTVADIDAPRGDFREFVMVFQDDINLRDHEGDPVPPVAGGTPEEPSVEDSEDSANKALNYRTEPMWTRLGYPAGADLGFTNDLDFTDALSIAGTGPIETPIFTAPHGMPVRFRGLLPQGHSRNHVIILHGHSWRHEPGNRFGEVVGSQEGHGSGSHWDIVPLRGAGGGVGAEGDYLIRDGASLLFDGGIWGVFRVTGTSVTP